MNNTKKEICSFDNLYKAMKKCKNGVMWKDSVARYVNDGLINVYKLRRQLLRDTYKIDKYSLFVIHEPKTREIVSTKFKDRVFQRSLTDNYLYEKITKGFIYDNCACQIGRGTDYAMDRLNCHLQRYFRKHGLGGWVLKCDFKNYFGSTPHKTAKEAIAKRINDEWVLNHVYKIIESFNQGDNPDIGMGLGSQITQLTQLAVPDDMDHFIKEKLKIKYYIRYMDDFILIHNDKEYLKYCLGEIKKFINPMGISLNIKKTQISPISQGIKFLGFTFRLTETGKVIRVLNKDNVKKRKRKLKKFKTLVEKGMMTREDIDESYTSWKAHANKGNSYNLIKRMDEYYNNLWKDDENV